MPFICPQCGAHALEIIRSLELPGDASSDEITLQQIFCARCGLQGAAVYQESRRGRLDSESWDHSGYRLEDGDYRRLGQLMQACPTPGEPGCHCETHLFFSRVDSAGCWRSLVDFHTGTPFPMIIK